METFNALGFTNFWGVTPGYNVLSNESVSDGREINILLSNTNDIRHVLKTCFENFEQKKPKIKLRFYVYERQKENLARLLVFMHIFHDFQLSMRDRVELFMEIYGNTLLSSRTADYLNNLRIILTNFISRDKKYTGVLNKFIDLSNLSFREIEDISQILKAYDLRVPFDIEKYRDDRLRFHFKDRYDYRENLVDWDYAYKLQPQAPVVHKKHYTQFRMNGITFEMRINSYFIPNRTLSSYIPGRTKEGKDSCLVRGFWGDITNSPYIGFGVELNNCEEHDFFYSHQDVYYKFHSQHITEWNLARYLTRLEKDELYELKFTEHKKTPAAEENEKNKDKENADETSLSTEASCNDKKNMEEANDEKEKPLEAESDKETKVEVNLDNLSVNDNNDNKEVPNSNNDKFQLNEENKDKMLMGFEYFDMKIYLLSGEIEQLFKKKKYKNFFDYIALGIHSKNIFDKAAEVLKPEGKILAELSTYMATFEEKEKLAMKEKYKTIGNEHGFILDDQSSNYMWKYIYRPKIEEKADD